MKKTLIFIFVLSLVSMAFALKDTKIFMIKMMAEVIALKKHMVSEKTFSDPKNEADISLHLKRLSKLASEAGHHAELKKRNFSFSRQVLEEQIRDTERIFHSGNKSYARWQLSSLVSVCASCHTQLPAKGSVFADFANPAIFTSQFDQAEFLFAIRAFEDSMKLYSRVINGYPDGDAKAAQVETALKRELAYGLRIQRDPSAAVDRLNSHLRRKDLWPALSAEMSAWVRRLKDLERQLPLDVSSYSGKKLAALAETQLKDKSDLIAQLQLSGYLYEYLNTHKSDESTPEILYWLAVSEREISNDFFFSLADMYLKECMSRYPQSPVAKKCYALYEEETSLGYTGSAGVNIPQDVKRELEYYKKLLEPEKVLNP